MFHHIVPVIRPVWTSLALLLAQQFYWSIKILNGTLPRWWFQTTFIFTPSWGNHPIWRAYFSNGLVQPPTSYQWTPDQVSCELELSDTQVFSGSVKRRSCWRFLGIECAKIWGLRCYSLETVSRVRPARNKPKNKERKKNTSFLWPTTGVIKFPIWWDQTMQMYGDFEGFPLLLCIVWVGVL